MLILIGVEAYAADPMSKLQKMVDDLGGDMAQVSRNNGKTIKCVRGGTKKITIRFSEKSSTYSAYYDNCRENNDVRDSIYEIETVGMEVVRDEEKPTRNRELFDAAMLDDVTKVRLQLSGKANVNVFYKIPKVEGGDINGWTPLMSAAANGNLEIVKLLVKEGAWINYLNGDVRNALWYATTTGKTELVKYLLEKGAYVNNSDISNMTPLMMAAVNGDSEIVKLLISYKANINMRHKDGDTALMFAVANGRSEIANVLISAGADLNAINKQGVTALIICAVENNIEVAKLLISNKVDVTAKTDFGKTALDIASAKGHTQLVHLLSDRK
jgi:ankyrin repeat protein